jgi:hypothetical protein
MAGGALTMLDNRGPIGAPSTSLRRDGSYSGLNGNAVRFSYTADAAAVLTTVSGELIAAQPATGKLGRRDRLRPASQGPAIVAVMRGRTGRWCPGWDLDADGQPSAIANQGSR